MTLDLAQFARRILEGETPEEVQATIAAAQAQYEADMRERFIEGRDAVIKAAQSRSLFAERMCRDLGEDGAKGWEWNQWVGRKTALASLAVWAAEISEATP